MMSANKGALLFVLSALQCIARADDTRECTSYPAKLSSVPDLTHNIAYQERRYPNYVIDTVKNTNYKRSYYWCELDLQESDTVFKRYRHFGFNSTHWWVEKGCGGWFVITECKPLDDAAEEHSFVQDLDVINLDSPGETIHPTNPQDASNPTTTNSVDDVYKSWPRVGYHFPTSDLMWDILDKATWVDVPAQLGFYQKHRKARSVAFD
ncbi:uncharacterized protein LOC101857236 [Aplysia californica]|uniref:Uncharacterized protein LOC101857236 n=1 Tax=Aplysia californica TaxID=6500 RepID=A0ABM0ZVQ6_APLCA|nr:uncharacterized protein LOC101857236 [Aplysia californica]